MKSFQQLSFVALALVSASLYRSATLDQREKAGIHARDASASVNRFTSGFQKRQKVVPPVTDTLSGQIPNPKADPLEGKPSPKGDKKVTSKGGNQEKKERPVDKGVGSDLNGSSTVATPTKGINKSDSNDDKKDKKEDTPEQVEDKIKKIKSDLKHLKKKTAKAESKLKALKKKIGKASSPTNDKKNDETAITDNPQKKNGIGKVGLAQDAKTATGTSRDAKKKNAKLDGSKEDKDTGSSLAESKALAPTGSPPNIPKVNNVDVPV